MGRKIICLALVLILILCAQLFASCFLMPYLEYEPDLLNVPKTPIVKATNSVVEENTEFLKNTTTFYQDITFDSSLSVTSFYLYAKSSGTFRIYAVDSENTDKIELLVHTGSFTSDVFETLPVIVELNENYRYTVEVKALSRDLLGKTVRLRIEVPSGARDISNVSTFSDYYEKGSVLWYTFTPRVSGRYSFTIKNNLSIAMYENDVFELKTGWGTLTVYFYSDKVYSFKVEMRGAVPTGRVYGKLCHPLNDIDVTQQIQADDCVTVVAQASYDYETSLKITFTANKSTDYYIAKNYIDVDILSEYAGNTIDLEISCSEKNKLVDFKNGWKISVMSGDKIVLNITIDEATLEDKPDYAIITIYNSWLDADGDD